MVDFGVLYAVELFELPSEDDVDILFYFLNGVTILGEHIICLFGDRHGIRCMAVYLYISGLPDIIGGSIKF